MRCKRKEGDIRQAESHLHRKTRVPSLGQESEIMLTPTEQEDLEGWRGGVTQVAVGGVENGQRLLSGLLEEGPLAQAQEVKGASPPGKCPPD